MELTISSTGFRIYTCCSIDRNWRIREHACGQLTSKAQVFKLETQVLVQNFDWNGKEARIGLQLTRESHGSWAPAASRSYEGRSRQRTIRWASVHENNRLVEHSVFSI